MTNKNVAKTAGSIWHKLGEKGRVDLIQLPKLIKQKAQLAYMALGWLARENKVKYLTRNSRIYVLLTPPEKNAYRQLAAAKA